MSITSAVATSSQAVSPELIPEPSAAATDPVARTSAAGAAIASVAILRGSADRPAVRPRVGRIVVIGPPQSLPATRSRRASLGRSSLVGRSVVVGAADVDVRWRDGYGVGGESCATDTRTGGLRYSPSPCAAADRKPPAIGARPAARRVPRSPGRERRE